MSDLRKEKVYVVYEKCLKYKNMKDWKWNNGKKIFPENSKQNNTEEAYFNGRKIQTLQEKQC